MFKGFRDFIVKGNVINLSVAVALGAAFGNVVQALIGSVLMPLIAGLFGKPNFDDVLVFMINNSKISIGAVVTALVNFLLISLAMYVIIVIPLRKFRAFARTQPEDEEDEELQLLREIRDALVSK